MVSFRNDLLKEFNKPLNDPMDMRTPMGCMKAAQKTVNGQVISVAINFADPIEVRNKLKVIKDELQLCITNNGADGMPPPAIPGNAEPDHAAYAANLLAILNQWEAGNFQP